MNQNYAKVSLVSFSSGILLRSFIDFGWAFAWFFIFIGFILLFLSFVMHNKQVSILLFLFFIFAGLGMMRYEIKDSIEIPALLQEKINSQIELEGIVIEEIDERESYTRLIVETNQVNVLIYAHHYPEFNYGDKIKVNGVLKKPSNFSSDFSWIDYLAKDDIYFEMFYPEIEFVSYGHGSWIKSKMLLVKGKFLESLVNILPEPHASFMGGITVGAKRSIPKTLQEDFKRTGIIHVVVLSGYNITLVADTIMRFFSFLPGAFGIGLGIIAIFLFAVMTGASATVVRASIMAILVLIARATGRIYQITWALFLAGFFMILQNPKILRFDTSFQLSFLATLALIYLAPVLEKRLGFVTKKFQFREIVSATLSAQIFVLPLLLYKMGLFSVVALPVNFLVLLFIPITMFFGFITAGIGMFSTALSAPFGWISYAFLQYELWIVKIFSALPFASFNIPNFPLWLMLGIYIIYVIIIYKTNDAR